MPETLIQQDYAFPPELDFLAADPRYHVGITHYWEWELAKKPAPEASASEAYARNRKATRCLGFFTADEKLFALLRKYVPKGRFIGGGKYADHQYFHVEQLFDFATGLPYKDPYGVSGRQGITIDIIPHSGRFIFTPGWVYPGFGGVDWADFTAAVVPLLTEELLHGEPLYTI